VFQQDVESVSASDFTLFLWAFIDADARSTGIPEKLIEDCEHNIEVRTQTSISCSPPHRSEMMEL
jgi:hypothetical protein